METGYELNCLHKLPLFYPFLFPINIPSNPILILGIKLSNPHPRNTYLRLKMNHFYFCTSCAFVFHERWCESFVLTHVCRTQTSQGVVSVTPSMGPGNCLRWHCIALFLKSKHLPVKRFVNWLLIPQPSWAADEKPMVSETAASQASLLPKACLYQEEDQLIETLKINHTVRLTHSPAQCRVLLSNLKELKIFRIEPKKLK